MSKGTANVNHLFRSPNMYVFRKILLFSRMLATSVKSRDQIWDYIKEVSFTHGKPNNFIVIEGLGQ